MEEVGSQQGKLSGFEEEAISIEDLKVKLEANNTRGFLSSDQQA